MENPGTEPRGVLAWMARKSIAANLMMLLLILGGFISQHTDHVIGFYIWNNKQRKPHRFNNLVNRFNLTT